MAPQNTACTRLHVLRTIFELGCADIPPTVEWLASLLDNESSQIESQLGLLEEQGLVRAAQVRLTMAGLVMATKITTPFTADPHHGTMDLARAGDLAA